MILEQASSHGVDTAPLDHLFKEVRLLPRVSLSLSRLLACALTSTNVVALYEQVADPEAPAAAVRAQPSG